MINFYLYLKNGFGFINSFEMAFNIHPLEILSNIIFIVAITALLIISFDSIIEGLEYENNKRAAYTHNLEKTLAKCLSPGDHAIIFEDNSILMCGAVNGGKHE